MKRIKAACITQTLHFLLKEDVSSDYAKKLVTEEVKKYKDSLNKNKTQYKIQRKHWLMVRLLLRLKSNITHLR